MILGFDPTPKQDDYDESDIKAGPIGRRQLRTEWPKALYAPDDPTKNWTIILPFPNTFQNAFFSMCDVAAYPHTAATGKLCLFLNGTEGDAEPPAAAQNWLDVVSDPVVMRDHLALSCALDYERDGGNPNCQQTAVGALRSQAKPYGANAATEKTTQAADELAGRCIEFLNKMSCYESADCLVAMPPSDPTKEYNLPRYLAEWITEGWGRENLTHHVRTVKARGSIKNVALGDKLDTLLDTIEVDHDIFAGRNVLLVDDLYQSGTSMNYCGLLLLRAGAERVFGLACEKTCRNDDNVGGRG